MEQPTILYEDNHLLGLLKPAGWIVQGAGEDDDSMLAWGKADLKRRHGKPGNVFLAAVSRLDRPVSGVVLLAKTSKAAARINEQIRNREVEKLYTAMVSPPPQRPQASLCSELRRDEARGITSVTRNLTPEQFDANNPAHAALSYHVESSDGRCARIVINLITGRKHQIRAQLSAIGSPIWGDKKYGGSAVRGLNGIALHCFRFTCRHPTRSESVSIDAAPQWPSIKRP